MAQTGPWEWSTYESQRNIWLAGREIGTGDNVKANIRWTYPSAIGGVPVGLGFYHQATRASPKAAYGATNRAAFAIDFTPQLDEDTNRHIQAVLRASGIATIWFPWAMFDSWRITAARTQYTLSFTISGTAATWPTGITPFLEPIVEVRETNGELVATLTRVGSSPGPTEYMLVNTTADQDFITTGDLTAHDGRELHIWAWGRTEVARLGLEEGWVGRGVWGQTLSLEFAPSPRDYESDT